MSVSLLQHLLQHRSQLINRRGLRTHLALKTKYVLLRLAVGSLHQRNNLPRAVNRDLRVRGKRSLMSPLPRAAIHGLRVRGNVSLMLPLPLSLGHFVKLPAPTRSRCCS